MVVVAIISKVLFKISVWLWLY